ncbi:ribonuclease [Brumimicrobium glaciale]|uniref:Ribonuclease n=1 Tax=Brumimicrobium glaciale TaxID=200475 RepID=A0A4Q4KRU5_9FLAO|nr:endonuclease [Brumimicrobium glaciale]RYM35735.1 ribonuclease [Brumimicrobium glaciale]
MKLFNHLRFQLLFFLIFGWGINYAQIPKGYYNSAEGLKGTNLKAALNDIIDGHVKFPYTSSNTDVWDILKETDKDTIDPSKVILLYTGWTVDAAQEYNRGGGWTREHVWAKSRGNFGTSQGAGTDVHALRPCDVSVNSARSNRWFDCGDYEYIDGDGATGSYTSSSSWVWEPRDMVKGDVARMIFYMATRYEGESGELDLFMIDSIPSDNKTKAPVHGRLSVLLQWHNDDPVDDWELNRNEVIYSYQGNRNPFIDRPEFVEGIWGEASMLEEKVGIEKVELAKIVDIFGREVEARDGVVRFYFYSDGRVVRVFEP